MPIRVYLLSMVQRHGMPVALGIVGDPQLARNYADDREGSRVLWRELEPIAFPGSQRWEAESRRFGGWYELECFTLDGLPALNGVERRTIEGWCARLGVILLDPAGFDRSDPDLYTRLFTEAEFRHGALRSTLGGDGEWPGLAASSTAAGGAAASVADFPLPPAASVLLAGSEAP